MPAFPNRKSLNAHAARSTNPGCKPKSRRLPSFEELKRRNQRSASNSHTSTSDDSLEDPDEDSDEEEESTAVPPPREFSGDFFGSASEYDDEDLPGWSNQEVNLAYASTDDAPMPQAPLSDESDSEDALAMGAEAAEATWEPAREAAAHTSESEGIRNADTHQASGPVIDEVTQRRMEAAFRQQIYIARYPSDVAGSSVSPAATTSSGYARYEEQLGHTGGPQESTNIYAPFANKTDWEFARFAKLRGPTSTAVEELLSIEGVRYLYALTSSITRMLTLQPGLLSCPRDWGYHTRMYAS